MTIRIPGLKLLFIVFAAASFLCGGLRFNFGKSTPDWQNLGLFFLTVGIFLL